MEIAPIPAKHAHERAIKVERGTVQTTRLCTKMMSISRRPSPASPGEPACDKTFCPLNRVKAGMAVRIKQLRAEPGVAQRLREIGFCEEQMIKLLATQVNVICLVCNARLALSATLAEMILVEPASAGAVSNASG